MGRVGAVFAVHAFCEGCDVGVSKEGKGGEKQGLLRGRFWLTCWILNAGF